MQITVSGGYLAHSAQVYCTVGNDDEAEYLTATFNIPRNHIFTYKDAAFKPSLMKETNHRGVDVVLSPLSGDLLHASWQCIAKRGKVGGNCVRARVAKTLTNKLADDSTR